MTDNGKTYVAFLEPDKTYYANIIREGKFHIGRKYSMQELEGHYAKVMRDMKEQRVEAVLPGREKIPQMAMKSVLSPK